MTTVGGATVGAQPRTIEGDIEISRDALDAFPAVLFASAMGFQQRTFFDLGENRAAAETAPQVKF